MSSPVRLSLAVDADTKDAQAAFDAVGASAKGMADDVDRAAADAGSGMSSFTDSADGAGSAAQTAAGAFGDLGGALAMVPGPIGAIGSQMETVAPAIQGVTGATDLLSLAMNSQIVTTVKNTAATVASTVAQTAASAASKAMAAAQWLLNAALSANPIGLVVIAVVALVANLVLLYNKSETVRGIIDKMGQVAVAAFKGIVDAAKKVWEFIGGVLGPVFRVYATIVKTQIAIVEGIIRGLWTVVKNITDNIKTAFENAWGKIKELVKWNPVQTIKNALGGVKEALTDPFEKAWLAIKGIFGSGGSIANIGDAMVGAVTSAVNAVIDVINALIRAYNKLPGPDIGEVGHVGKSATSGGTASRSTAAGRVAAPQTVTVNVYGAVDPYRTAQAIKRTLARGEIIRGRLAP